MDSLHTVKGKEVVIIGLARSGVAVAKLLYQQGAKIIVNDNKKIEDCPEAEELRQLGIPVICGSHPEDLIHVGLDFVVKNPGIPYRIAPLQKAMVQNIPIYTEVEIASWFMKAPVIGITGSNGKTTTTSLIGSILDEAGRSPIVAGNIGVALSEVAPKATEDQWVVAELSSFQLAGTHYFHPKIALLLNLFPAHLDFHGTIEDYEKSKAKIFANQLQSDYAILNADNENSLKWLSTIHSEVMLFSRLKRVDYGVYVDQGTVWYNDKCGLTMSIMEANDIKLLGQHNLENVLAAICTAIVCEVDTTTIARAVSTFEGVEHRLEYVRTKEGVLYYNDSKATNPVASIVSIES
ncbi:MAG: UDP-N-acetylmuramoyl-L-alanine--D-glutamate ligase, partial [Bacilli bacterium]